MLSKKIILFFLLLHLSQNVLAQNNIWEKLNAPVGLAVTGISQTISGDFYISSAGSGIYSSDNSGDLWLEQNNGLTYLGVNNIYSTAEGDLYACCGNGIFTFDSIAQNWINLNAPQGDYNSIFKTSNGTLVASSNMGLVRSSDEGVNWIDAKTQLSSIYSFLESKNGIIFCGQSSGVYKSLDHGDTWSNVGLYGFTITDMTFDKQGNLLANVFYRHQGVFRSEDNGQSWNQLNIGLENQLTTTVSIDSLNNIIVGTFEGKIFQKSPNNDSFYQINTNMGMSNILTMHVSLNNELFVGTEVGGVFKKDGINSEWIQLNNGLKLNRAETLGYDKEALYMSHFNGGFYRSLDEAKSWYPIAPYHGGSHLYTFHESNGKLYLATTIEFAFFGMLFQSDDQGETWNYFHEGIPLIHPDYPWIQPVFDIGSNSKGDLFAALFSSGVYIRPFSSDRWELLNLGLLDTTAKSLAINQEDIIFVGLDDGYIFSSSDDGISWIEILSGYKDYSVSILHSHQNDLFTIMHNNNFPYHESSLGLYSPDNGSTWYNLNTSNLGSRVNSIDCYNNSIFLGTDSNGVFLSDDYGENWSRINEGLEDSSIVGLFAHPNGYVICGTNSKGLFKRTITTTDVEEENSIPSTLSLLSNYPNPFNPTTTIEYTLPEHSFVSIKVYDVLGREVTTLLEEQLSSGNYRLDFNAAGLQSGIYFYQIRTKNHRGAKKMVLLK